MATSLEELRNKNNGTIIDATAGKITPASIVRNPTLAESDPAFMPSSEGPVKATKRTPVIGETPDQPGIKVVNAQFSSPDELMPFDVNTLEKRKPEPNQIEMELMDDLNKAVEREKESISQRIDELTEAQHKEFLVQKAKEEEAEYTPATASVVEDTVEETESSDTYDPDSDEDFMNEDYSEPPVVQKNYVVNAPTPIDNAPTIEIPHARDEVTGATYVIAPEEEDIDVDSDLNNLENDEPDQEEIIPKELDEDLAAESGESAPDMDKIMRGFGEKVKKAISPITKRFNLNDFKIGETAITRNEARMMGIETVSIADHFLPNAGKIISCSALSGTELMAMNPENSNRSRLNTLKDIYSIMYKHVVSDKPKTFDEWLKTTRFRDLDHIYFALYKATFSGSHFMHYECPNTKCQDVFIEDVPFEDMIVYADDETKEKMRSIMNSGDSSMSEYTTTLHQISDNIAVALRNPSIYNVIIEVSGLSDSFLTKYSDLMDVIVYIDNIYYIDADTMTLNPVDMMPDKNNLAKTVARRIKIISDILRTLPSDNYYEFRKCIADSFPSLANVTYRIPATTCKKCGTEIPAVDIEAQSLLFMRHQLGAFVVL